MAIDAIRLSAFSNPGIWWVPETPGCWHTVRPLIYRMVRGVREARIGVSPASIR